MRFEINFDRPQDQTEENYKLLREIEGVYEGELSAYGFLYIEIEDLSKLEWLEREIEKRFRLVSMIVGFDQPTIFLTEVLNKP